MKTIFLAILLLLTCYCPAQPTTYLGVGDELPALQLSPILGSDETIQTSRYKGKLLVIDFWSLSCASCIASFPKLDSLQQQFGDRLQILLVTRDPYEKVQNFFGRRKFRLPAIPIIASDTILSNYFYYEGVPHLVWINEKGKVIYITGGQQFSSLSLSTYFSGQPLSFTTQQLLPDFNMQEPLWKEGGGRLSHHLRYYSLLSGFLDEHTMYDVQVSRDSSGIHGLKVLNAPLLRLYQLAYGDLLQATQLGKQSRILIETRNREPFSAPNWMEEYDWTRRHSYCYELSIPPVPLKKFCAIMQQELARYFPYVVSVERRCQQVIVLEQSPRSAIKVIPKGRRSFQIDSELGRIQFINESSTAIASRLAQFFDLYNLPFVDATSPCYIGNFSLTYPFSDWKVIAKEIEPLGFHLSEREIEIDMLVIRDKPALPEN